MVLRPMMFEVVQHPAHYWSERRDAADAVREARSIPGKIVIKFAGDRVEEAIAYT